MTLETMYTYFFDVQETRLPLFSTHPTSRCMAVLCAQTNDVARSKTVARFVKDMQGNDEQRKHLGLLVVGELGRQSDLSSVKNLQVGSPKIYGGLLFTDGWCPGMSVLLDI